MTIKPQHQRFANAYLSHGNATQAYKDAGYKSVGNAAEASAYKLLRIPQVTIYIKERTQALANESVLDVSWILLKLQSTALDAADAGQYSAAIRAYELIGKHLGMFTDVKADDSAGEILEAFSKLFSKREQSKGEVIDVEPVSFTRALIEGTENAI